MCLHSFTCTISSKCYNMPGIPHPECWPTAPGASCTSVQWWSPGVPAYFSLSSSPVPDLEASSGVRCDAKHLYVLIIIIVKWEGHRHNCAYVIHTALSSSLQFWRQRTCTTSLLLRTSLCPLTTSPKHPLWLSAYILCMGIIHCMPDMRFWETSNIPSEPHLRLPVPVKGKTLWLLETVVHSVCINKI